MPLAGFAAGVGVGLILSVLGAGGSMFIVPVLVYAMHLPVSEATGTALAVVCSAAAVGAYGHWKKGNLDLKVTVPFGGAAIAGAFVGALLHSLVADRILLGLFAGTLFIAAARMALGNEDRARTGEPPKLWLLLTLGLGIGVFSGFLGVGGGFVIVPALTWGAKLPLRPAIGTSLAVISMSCLSGAIGHAIQGHVSPLLLATVGSGGVLGAFAGAPLSGKIPEKPLRLAFAVLVLCLGIYMTVRVVTSA
jgi:uncharacterized membrane protein YfcA